MTLLRYGAVAIVSASLTSIALRHWRFAPEPRSTPVTVPPTLRCPPCPTVAPPPPPPPPVDRSWTVNALSHRGHNGEVFVYQCPPEGEMGSVWGSDVYTDDSSVCTAALHSGRITIEQGGAVTIEMLPGRPRYSGSTRHGVISRDYAVWPGSFSVR